MEQEHLYQLIADEESLTPSDVKPLADLVEMYPYFFAAIFLYLKSVYLFDSKSFGSELQRLSVLVSNRDKLFYYIYKEDYTQYFRQTGKTQLKKDKTALLLNAFFGNEDPEVTTFEYETPKGTLAATDYLSYLSSEENSSKEKKTEYVLPIVVDDTKVEQTVKPLKHQNIIDHFLERSENESFNLHIAKEDLVDDRDYASDDDTKTNGEGNENVFFTETLAKIYVKQGKYEKAYEIIEHLSLKYSKKNSYFADQLSYLKKLIIITKYKNQK